MLILPFDMNLPLDDTRCNGASCQTKDDCKRFTDKPKNAMLWMADAKHGCVGFIPRFQTKQPKGKS